MMPDTVDVYDERGRLHYVDAMQTRALSAVGLIWKVNDRWHMNSSLDLRNYPELVLCDFCHEQPVTWAITADSFSLPIGFKSVGDWAACEPCGQAIANNDRQTLTRRTLTFINREAPGLTHQIIQLTMLREFWRHYRGITRYATPYREK